jgi:glycosyltransferase involved in cell wall biosynthesis
MRVAYDISFFAYNYIWGNRKSGVYRVIDSVLHALLQREDVQVELVGVCHRNPFLPGVIFPKYLQGQMNLSGARYLETVRSRIGGEGIFRAFYDAQIETMARSFPITARSLPFTVSIRALEVLQRTILYQKLDQNTVDVFHSPYLQFPPRQVTGTIPRVLTVYDLIPILAPRYTDGGLTRSLKGVIENIDREQDSVICISEYTKKEFIEYTKMSPDRVFVTPLAADEHFHPVPDDAAVMRCRKRYGIPDCIYFLTLAELQPRKNLSRLITAFIRFLSESRKKDVYLVLVGSHGWKYDEIFKTIERFSEYQDKIVFTGYVQEEDLASIYSGALLFIYPSLYEGFGLPPLEAMQCGVPVIASNSTSIPEVVGTAALLVDPLNIDEMCSSMKTLLDDESLRKQLREKGLQQARQFSWSKCAADTVRIYSSMITA